MNIRRPRLQPRHGTRSGAFSLVSHRTDVGLVTSYRGRTVEVWSFPQTDQPPNFVLRIEPRQFGGALFVGCDDGGWEKKPRALLTRITARAGPPRSTHYHRETRCAHFSRRSNAGRAMRLRLCIGTLSSRRCPPAERFRRGNQSRTTPSGRCHRANDDRMSAQALRARRRF